MKIKLISKILIIMMIFFISCSFSYQPNRRQRTIDTMGVNYLNCVAGTVIDQESGRVLYSKNGNRSLAMASTTKIITAIVAIEKGNLSDKVTVSQRAAAIRGSTVGLRAGEKLSLEELLYGLMLVSGNDASIAIAEHIGGNVNNFIKMMNDKAIELGALNTSFATPHGLDAQEHYTTAEDLAKITAYAMKNEMFAKVASTRVISSGVSGNFTRSYGNINKFLYRVENADGVKTGYTGRAGKCLVASIKNPMGRYICVILNSNDRWKDAERLVKYANTNFKFVKIYDKNQNVKKFRVYGGNSKYVNGSIEKDLYLPVLKNDSENFNTQLYAPSVLFSPVKKDEHIGNLVVYVNDKIIAKYPVRSSNEVKRKNFHDIVAEALKYLR